MKKILPYMRSFCAAAFVLVFFAVFAAPCMAGPACPEPFEAEQPNGRIITVKLHGDELFNWTTNVENDYVIVQDDDGYWKYAGFTPESSPGTEPKRVFTDSMNLYITNVAADQEPPSGAVKSAELSAMYQESPEYTEPQAFEESENGTVVYPAEPYRSPEKLLVVLVEFSNKSFTTTNTEWQNRFFGASNSVNSFYLENSNNRFQFQPATGSVSTSVIKVRLSSAHPNPASTSDSTIRTAVAQALSGTGINFKSFDTDNNGRLTTNELHIYLIFAGYEASYSSSYSPKIWAHRYSTSGSITTLNGVAIQSYALNGEMLTPSNPAQIGVSCHELGHSLGAPDLYNTTDSSDTNTPGGLSLMDIGSWGRASSTTILGSSPTHLDPWNKMYLNFYKPQTASGNLTLTSPYYSSSYRVLKIPITGTSEQYFLVEYRNRSGYDKGLYYDYPSYSGGVVFWLVDEGVITYQGNSRVNNLSRKGVMWVSYSSGNPFYPSGSIFSESRSLCYSSLTNYTSSTKKQSGVSVSVTGTTTISIKDQTIPVKSYGSLDAPTDNQMFNDTINISGWHLYSTDDGKTDAINRIEVKLDGTVAGGAERYERPDIKTAIQGFTDYSKCGFRMSINTYPYNDGDHTLTVDVINSSGVSVKTYSKIIKISKTPTEPVEISTDTVTVSAGYEHSVIIKTDGSVWTWGRNSYGQLGNGTAQDITVPQKITDSGAASVSAGRYHTMLLKQDGSLWAFGANTSGQLGIGSYANENSPVYVMNNVVSVSAGDDHTLVIKNDGSLWAFGSNSYGQLGDGTSVSKNAPVKILDGVAYASAGQQYSMAVKTDGSLWGWGFNSDGQLGDGTDEKRTGPVYITNNVISVSATNSHTLAVKNDGTLWTWGYNLGGTLGDGTTIAKKTPVMVMQGVKSASMSQYHTMAIKTDGSLWAFGWNDYGQLGNDSTVLYSTSPVYVTGDMRAVSTGQEFTMATKSDGTLWAWGRNDKSQLGIGNTVDMTLPAFVTDGIKLPNAPDIQDTSKHIGCLDSPAEGQTFSGNNVQVSGWYFYTKDGVSDDITGIEVFVDGISAGMAERYYRPDVAAAITDYGDAGKCGFLAYVQCPEGLHSVEVRVYGVDGKLVYEFTRSITIHTQLAKPFLMFVDSPTDGDTVSGSLSVRGWALYTVDGLTDAISTIQIALNDKYYEAERFRRDDVAAAVDGYGDYSNCGFTKTIDISNMPEGEAFLTIAAIAKSGAVVSRTMTVNIRNQGGMPLLYIVDTPADGAVVSGRLDVSGWALFTNDGRTDYINSVHVLLNSVDYLADRFYRADVENAIRGYGDYQNCGFKSTVDISSLPNGETTLTVVIIDKSFNVYKRNITVNIQKL